MARTILRIIRFLNYLKIMFSDMDSNRNKKFSDLCAEAYNEALAPYHTYFNNIINSLDLWSEMLPKLLG